MQDTKVINEARDHLGIADALYRFASGIDFNDADLLTSAFAENAIADFTPSAAKLGIEFPVLEGRESIVRGITNSVAQIENMLIDNVWFTGDPAVVQGQ